MTECIQTSVQIWTPAMQSNSFKASDCGSSQLKQWEKEGSIASGIQYNIRLPGASAGNHPLLGEAVKFKFI